VTTKNGKVFRKVFKRREEVTSKLCQVKYIDLEPNVNLFLEKPINNPRLAMVSVYHELVPDFERWLKACNNDYSRFYERVESISELPKDERIKALKQPADCH
jgi:predicted aminopeptidase